MHSGTVRNWGDVLVVDISPGMQWFATSSHVRRLAVVKRLDPGVAHPLSLNRPGRKAGRRGGAARHQTPRNPTLGGCAKNASQGLMMRKKKQKEETKNKSMKAKTDI